MNATKVAILCAVLVAVLRWNGIDIGTISPIKSVFSLDQDKRLLSQLFENAESIPQSIYTGLQGSLMPAAELTSKDLKIYESLFGMNFNKVTTAFQNIQ